MKSSIIIGMQWGDEGKGKIVDVMAKQANAVIRYQGGANAGHTVIIKNKKYVLHLLPTGILQNKISYIGNGVVVDIEAFIDELNILKAKKIEVNKLFISDRASILLDLHKMIDKAKEMKRGKSLIGTTKKGIGPAYVDKYARIALKISDMRDKKFFVDRLGKYIDYFNNTYTNYYNIKRINKKRYIEKILNIRKEIVKYIVHSDIIAKKLYKQKTILFEGAQGAMLDIDFGTYPYVTSSHPIAQYAFCGSGIPVLKDYQVMGVAKSYTTRVGKGVFPTRMNKKDEKIFREKGGEFGATTGRPRDCGWLDLFALKYVSFLNGIDKIALTKIDIMADIKEIKVCIGYKIGNRTLNYYPATSEISKVKPIYKILKGWTNDDVKLLSKGKITKPIKIYIDIIEKYTSAKVSLISTGPQRNNIVKIGDL